MKILILNWRDPIHPLAGGAEKMLLEHAKVWLKNKSSITWFSSSFSGAKKVEYIDGIRIIRYGSQYTVHIIFLLYYLSGKCNKVNIIIDNFHFIPFFTPLYVRKIKIISVIHEIAGKLWFLNIYPPFSFIGYYLEPIILKLYKSISFITVSNSTKRELEQYGVPSNKIYIVHNGINTIRVSKKIEKERIPTIIYLGRISKDKGIIDALLSFQHVLHINKNVVLWVVGREEHKGILNKIIKSYSLDEKIIKKIVFYDYVTEEKKFELLKRAWILIHPSKKEGWGLTAVEAASQGTPTIGYNVSGLRDSVVAGTTGILTKENNNALSHAIENALSNTKERMRMSKNAILWSKKFSWRKSGKQSWKIIKTYTI